MERIRTSGGLQVVRLVPRADVDKLLAANSGHKALLLERYLRNEVFPRLDAEEKATAQVRALIVGFISTMQENGFERRTRKSAPGAFHATGSGWETGHFRVLAVICE